MCRSHRDFFLAVGLVLFLPGPGFAGDTQRVPTALPAGFAALVPSGAKLSAPSYFNAHEQATVSFAATKPVGNDHVTYSLTLHCYSDKLWRALGATYRRLVEEDAEKARKRALDDVRHYSGNGSGEEIYPPEVKSFPWGKGIVQRRDWHEMGVSPARPLPVVTTYRCTYGGVGTRCTFSITVRGPTSPEEANAWAVKCAAKAEGTDLGNIGN